MGKRGVTIHFKHGKVSGVSGARSPREFREATAFGIAFIEDLKTSSPARGQSTETTPKPSDAPAEEKDE